MCCHSRQTKSHFLIETAARRRERKFARQTLNRSAIVWLPLLQLLGALTAEAHTYANASIWDMSACSGNTFALKQHQSFGS